MTNDELYPENDIYNADSLKALTHVPSNKVQLIITDPPWGIDFKDNLSGYNRWDEHVVKGYNEIDRDDYEEFSMSWIKECRRVLRNDGSMYIFSGFNNLEYILKAIRLNKLHLKNQLIWEYPFGMRTTRKYVTGHCNILFVTKTHNYKFYPFCRYGLEEKDKNGGSLHYRDKYSVIRMKKEKWPFCKKTPTKLPRELISRLIDYSSKEGDLLMDPFSGSGNVLMTGRSKGRKILGFEISERIYAFSKERLDSNKYLIAI